MSCYVWSDLQGEPHLVGAAGMTGAKAGEFQYAPAYLAADYALSIDPLHLPLAEGLFPTRANDGVWGVLTDAGPDGWGKRILAALHPKRMANAGPLEVLLMSSGHGVGALLFSESSKAVKPRVGGIAMADLGAAAEAAQQMELGEVPREQLRQILEFSTSLGGMHPKVAVRHEGVDWIAKFRSRDDVVDTPRIEWASMRLARECGIDAAHVELRPLVERASVAVQRFDREGDRTLHYASAHALWNRASFNEKDYLGWASYGGIVELMKQLPCADVKEDARELFRRMAFNVIIGNTDDHGRNHGFLMDAKGRWRLSPAFDVLPNVGAQGVVQALGLGLDGPARSIDNLLSAAAGFALEQPKAMNIVADIQAKVASRFAALLREAHVPDADMAVVVARVLKA